MLKAIENPSGDIGQGIMVTPEGGYVVAQPDLYVAVLPTRTSLNIIFHLVLPGKSKFPHVPKGSPLLKFATNHPLIHLLRVPLTINSSAMPLKHHAAVKTIVRNVFKPTSWNETSSAQIARRRSLR